LELRNREGVKPCRDTTEPGRWESDRSRVEALAAVADPARERHR
jgi:hypothetical protein